MQLKNKPENFNGLKRVKEMKAIMALAALVFVLSLYGLRQAAWRWYQNAVMASPIGAYDWARWIDGALFRCAYGGR